MAKSNAERQKEYRERVKAYGHERDVDRVNLYVPSEAKRWLKKMAKGLNLSLADTLLAAVKTAHEEYLMCTDDDPSAAGYKERSEFFKNVERVRNPVNPDAPDEEETVTP